MKVVVVNDCAVPVVDCTMDDCAGDDSAVDDCAADDVVAVILGLED